MKKPILAGFLLAAAAVGLSVPSAAPPRFTEHLVSNDYSYAYGIWAADIDGDGRIDLTSADAREHNALYWYENTAKDGFRRHIVYQAANKEKTEKGALAEENGRLERHVVADVNHDRRPDIVIVDNKFGDVLWFENSGTPKDGRPWKRHVISKGGMPGAYDVDMGDLNGDGKPDAVASGWRFGNDFAWFENPGKSDAPWVRRRIDGDAAETRNVRLADFNGDGRLDLLATATRAGFVAWYENPGKKGSSWTKHVIDVTGRPAHGHAVDLDGDGDQDVVMAAGMAAHLFPSPVPAIHEVVWYENEGKRGKGTRWIRHVISETFDQGLEAVAADLNGDGRIDVVATGWRLPGRVTWFENPGNPSGRWTPHILKEPWKSANQVVIADLDGDRRPDIVAGADQGSNEVRWWRNEGSR